MGAVDVKHTQEHELTLEWDSSASNDMIADSTLALITGIDKSPASVKRECDFVRYKPRLYPTLLLVIVTSHSHSHSHSHKQKHPHADKEFDQLARNQSLARFLEAHFGEVELHIPDDMDESEQGEDEHDASLFVQLDEADATINLVTLVCTVTSAQTPFADYPFLERLELERNFEETRGGGAGYGYHHHKLPSGIVYHCGSSFTRRHYRKRSSEIGCHTQRGGAKSR